MNNEFIRITNNLSLNTLSMAAIVQSSTQTPMN